MNHPKSLEDAELARPRYGLGASFRLQLFEETGDMRLDGVRRDAELFRDFLVRAALRQQCEYFKFAIADTERFAHFRVGFERPRGRPPEEPRAMTE